MECILNKLKFYILHLLNIARRAELKAFDISDKLTTDSKSVQKNYKEKFNANFIYLPAPLDVQTFKGISQIEKRKIK